MGWSGRAPAPPAIEAGKGPIVAREHDDRRLETVPAQDAHSFAAVDVGQADIHDDQIDLSRLGSLHALIAVLSRDGFILLVQGSVKLRCALGPGSSNSGAVGLPGFSRPSALRCYCFSASMWRSSSAASLASASSAAIASWIFASVYPYRWPSPASCHHACRKSRPLGHPPPWRPPNMQATSALNSASRFFMR